MKLSSLRTIPYICAILGIFGLFLAIVGVIIGLIGHFSLWLVWRIVFGTIFVLFVPGFVWSYVFFPRKNDRGREISANEKQSILFERGRRGDRVENHEHPLDVIERITLSLALSMAMGPLLIFFLNKVGVKITTLAVLLEIISLIVAGLVTLFFVLRKKIN